MTEQQTAPRVYAAISAVTASLARKGIGKNQHNRAQDYKFRGIDDLYNALGPALAEAGLMMLPTVEAREVVERTTKSGTTQFHCVLRVRYTLAATDGSTVDIVTYGESMDTSDKATNKAMSAAMKYAAIQVFAIPVVGTEDADHDSPEAVTKAAPPKPVPATKPEAAPASVTTEPMTPATKREIADLAKVLGWNADKTTEVVRELLKVEKKDLTELQAQTLLGAMKAEVEKRLAAEAARATSSE